MCYTVSGDDNERKHDNIEPQDLQPDKHYKLAKYDSL